VAAFQGAKLFLLFALPASGLDLSFGQIQVRSLSDHVFQAFQRKYLDNIASRLGFEHHLFTGERVDTFA
jgi:hypothetical protein